MKTVKILLPCIVAVLLTSCESASEKQLTTEVVQNPQTAAALDVTTLPIIKFEEEVYDFGKISQGEKVKHAFKFRNIGKSDLIITSARGSCGCTVPDWPKNPIPAGEEGVVNVEFDSEGKSGVQHKQVTVVANTQPNTTVFAVKGEVIAPEKK